MRLAITGHRPPRLGGYRQPNPIFDYVRDRIDHQFMELLPERVIVGMAQGVDFIAAELCIFNEIPFTAAIPVRGGEDRWPPQTQARYRQLLSHASLVEYISEPPFTMQSIRDRNLWMVNNCDTLLAVWDGIQEGGTWMTINMARSRGVATIYEILPTNIVALAGRQWRAEEERRTQARARFSYNPSPPREVPRVQYHTREIPRSSIAETVIAMGRNAVRREARARQPDPLSERVRLEEFMNRLNAVEESPKEQTPTGRDYAPRRRIDVGED